MVKTFSLLNIFLSFKLLSKEEKMMYKEKAHKENEKRSSQKTVAEVNAEKGAPFNVAE